MKKISIIFLSVTTLGLAVMSCNTDDDKNETSIVGKWEATSQGEGALGKESLVHAQNPGGCKELIIEFTDDGKSISTRSSYDGTNCSSEVENATYNKEGNTLNIMTKENGKVDTESYEILELSDKTLKVGEVIETINGIKIYWVAVLKKI